MAKTRSRSRKSGASAGRTKRAKMTKKAAAGKRKTSTKGIKRGSRANDSLDFTKLRRDIDKAVAVLARRVQLAGQPSAKLSETQAALGRWASDIDSIICDPDEVDGPCGPTMLIEFFR